MAKTRKSRVKCPVPLGAIPAVLEWLQTNKTTAEHAADVCEACSPDRPEGVRWAAETRAYYRAVARGIEYLMASLRRSEAALRRAAGGDGNGASGPPGGRK